eukprot:TRINITY_DN7874_c0_g1_i2.p1 TRINITY_DN7874_c0_g1~~TRINITY_DN7874_c0_g1_i2.p1  ORF type:complete len:287 (-),score=40.92 TRINITY_DN7874_c0_g1_i2:8-868(-)
MCIRDRSTGDTQKITDLPDKLNNKTIVIASDFHFCPQNKLLPELTVKEINKQNADLVFLLGDFITDDPKGIEILVSILKNIKAKKGVYAIFGNHDISWGNQAKTRMRDAFKNLANIQLLENQEVWPWGKDFAIVGLGDWWSPNKQDFKPKEAFQNVPNNIPRIVLTHNPDSIYGFTEYRADLILCGHTHAGSIALPFVGSLYPYLKKCAKLLPKTLLNKIPYSQHAFFVKHEEHIEGLYDLKKENQGKYPEGRSLIITRGVGSHFNVLRFLVPPEIMTIKLEKQIK